MIKATSTFTTALSALVIACAMAAFFASPAAAGNGVKCNGCVNSKDIKNHSIKKKDLTAALQDVIFFIADTDAVSSNGPLKAWAKIAADGTVIACDRCNTDSGQTMQVGAGLYHVDFTPLGTDLSGRPFSTLINLSDGGNGEVGQISAMSLGADPSTVLVRTEGASGAAADKAFTNSGRLLCLPLSISSNSSTSSQSPPFRKSLTALRCASRPRPLSPWRPVETRTYETNLP